MAVSTGINPYAAGAVVFDQRPFLAFYERQMARDQAKKDAMNTYFRDLGKNITPAGMRSQDVPTLLKKQQEWNQLGTQQKAAIVNPKLDNGKALNEFQSRYNDMRGLIEESKGALKTMDEVGKMRLKPEMSYVSDDPQFIDQIAKHELPIGDPKREGLNLATISLPPKPLETKDWDSYNKYLTGNVPHDKIPGRTEDVGDFKTKTPIYTQYSPENQAVIGQHAMNAYDTDKRFRLEANKTFQELKNDPVMFDQYNKVFKSLYGNDIDNPKEAWAAKGILDNNMKATEYKEGENKSALMAAQEAKERRMQAMRHADAKDLIKYKKEIDPNDTELNNVWYQSYLDNIMNTAKQSGERHHVYKNGKTVTYYNMIKPDPFIMKAFTRGKSEPDRMGVTESGELMPIFFKYKSTKDGGGVETTSDGAPVLDTDYSQPISYDQALVALGYRGSTKKQLKEDQQKIQSGKQSASNTHPLPAGKPRSVTQGGHIYQYNENTGQYE